jgi:hypothetical protein
MFKTLAISIQHISGASLEGCAFGSLQVDARILRLLALYFSRTTWRV